MKTNIIFSSSEMKNSKIKILLIKLLNKKKNNIKRKKIIYTQKNTHNGNNTMI